MSTTTIHAKVAILGRRVEEFTSTEPATIAAVLRAVNGGVPETADIRLNGKPAAPSAPVEDGDIVAVVPKIRGGAAAHDVLARWPWTESASWQ